MRHFIINQDILYAIDTIGIVIINTKDSSAAFLNYPEAAVWSVLIENKDFIKSTKMLQSILNQDLEKTKVYIDKCLNRWAELNLIQ
jgi:hypothetical protein